VRIRKLDAFVKSIHRDENVTLLHSSYKECEPVPNYYPTDGTDGATDAAGAIADGTTVQAARGRGYDAARYLANNYSYHFFEVTGDLLMTGPLSKT